MPEPRRMLAGALSDNSGLAFQDYSDQLVPVVRVFGEVDISNARELEIHVVNVLIGCEPASRTAVIDLTRVGFFGAAGLGVLTAANGWCGDGSRLRLVAITQLAHIIRLTGLDDAMSLDPTVEEALARS